MTVFQNRCLCAFRDIKLKQGLSATIMIKNNQPGVMVSNTLWYPMDNIMDPINRLMNSPRPSKSI